MVRFYDDNSTKIMKAAETAARFRVSRIEEIREFAVDMNIERIGIAHCITFSKEAKIIQTYLSKDFDVVTVDCKYGRLRKGDLLGGSSSRILCNPAGQAAYLNDQNTSLNISVGLCVGHDMIFNTHSQAPVTTLLCKDFTNNHNPGIAVEGIGKEL